MKDNICSLPVYFSVNNEISDKNNRFISVTIDVLHTGLNYNGSIFNKDVVNENIETIKNTPILGFITEVSYDEKDFKGHEYVIVKDENGVKRKYIGEAFGMIPESCNPRWVTKLTDSGVEREFLQVDGILWSKFQDAADIMLNDIEKPQSMELYPYDIDGYENDDGNFVFSKFSFDGCCILGSKVEPAMENAKIEVVNFTMSDFVKNIQSELINKYSAFTKLVNDTASTNIVDDTNAFTKQVNENDKGGIVVMPNMDFSTVLQMFDDISTTIAQREMIKDRWGDEYPRYYAVDIQENEVIVVDRANNYNYFGFSFVMNGDSVEIDFESGKRKKISYEDYVEGTVVPEGSFDFGKHIADIEESAFSKVNEANEKVATAEADKATAEAEKETAESNYTAIKADYDEIKPKYDAYVQADEQRQADELNAQKDAKFAEYEDDLAENADFIALKERKDELSVDEIDKECAVLYVKANRAKSNFAKVNSTPAAVGVIEENGDTDGYIETKYGRIRKSR